MVLYSCDGVLLKLKKKRACLQFTIKDYRGLYIGKYFPSPGGGISADVIWGKNMKRRRGKRGKYERKRKKGERIRRKGKENEKRGSKRVQ
jgi:hypothetical protein